MPNISIITTAFNNLRKRSHHIIDDEATTLQLINVNGLLAHVCFIFLFLVLDIAWLALVNVISVVAWSISIILTILHRYRESILLIAFEISSHAAIATIELGLAAGFHLYLWPAVLLMCVIPARNNVASYVCLGMILFPLLLLNLFAPFEKSEYLSLYTPLFVFNLILASIPFIIIAAIVRLIYLHNVANMKKQAETDELTGLMNRRRGMEYLKSCVEDSQPVCIALADIDHFKQVNDSFGHQIGDNVLISLSNLLKQRIKTPAASCRWGGEEFLFIFPTTELEQAAKLLHELCLEIPEAVKVKGVDRPITCSFGLIQIIENEPIHHAIARVDTFLYQAKDSGRFQVKSQEIHV